MANVTTDFSNGRKATATEYDSGNFPLYFDYTIPTGFVLAAGDTLELGPLQPYVQPMDITVLTNGVAATGAFSVGLLNTAKTALDVSTANGGAAWMTAVAVTAGVTRATVPAVALTSPDVSVNRSIAIAATTSFGTITVGSKLTVIVTCKPA